MGLCTSQPAHSSPIDKSRSDAIDKQIEEDAKKFKRECKILLLGSGESGKSTIVKQMRIIHKNGFPPEERKGFAPIVYSNVLESIHAIITMLRRHRLDVELEYENRPLADMIMDYKVDESVGFRLNEEVCEAIDKVWRDPVVARLLEEHGSEFYLMDTADYFFNGILRIGSPTYIPSESDLLHIRQKSTGITETRFTMGNQLSIHMFDVGGQRSERRKWIHCFESVTSIIFCTALSEYDQVLLEEKSQNRMEESLILFESIINSRWFLRTSIILFLNKTDVFKRKLPKVPLEKYFTEYTGGNDINKAAKYVLWKFMQANRANLSVYPHLTQATDTTNIRLVFAAVKETILQNALKASGIL
ncbi:g-protein alpha-subunit [Moniliophthora roreri MCA 2997]|uniref:Guanine nucleotide-binding protein subunit alpha n=2 Tax=Moniliophthora roreri TaxID=221103 RepID=V2WXI5_MONRO|nr:g-protein alpha-subunit [Moniliophthora roreri MCA 2997]KAI3602243.1 g-protein alpha-subunit [Moniliophthora roreri]